MATDLDHVAVLRDAFEDAPFEFWARDLEGRCTVANAATRRLGSILGHTVDDAPVPPEMRAAWHANNRRALAGEVVQNEFEYLTPTGKRYLHCYIVPLRIHGEIRGILGFNIDLTDHKETERRLSEALRIGRMGYLDWDLVTNAIKWSPETFRLFGHEPGGTFTPSIEATVGMVPKEDAAYVQRRLDAAISGSEPYDLDHRMVRPDGEVIHVHAYGEVQRDEHGRAVRMLGTVADVTERRRAEEELRAVDRRRSEFLGLLSHELRNPLAVIGCSLRSLERVELADDHARRAVAAIDRQTRHLSRLVDDLLDITRISSGKISLQCAAVSLGELVRRTVDDHRELLAGKRLALELPDSAVWLRGDPTRLAQVVGNLLTNAAKFTPDAGEITIAVAAEADRAVLTVTDTGVGIDPGLLDHVFEPFVQADRGAEHSSDGLGLGLSLVRKLVGLHGGTATAHSLGPGQGARVTIALPIAAAPQPAAPAASFAGTPRKVLVIEDNQDAAEWLATALSFQGHQVTITFDGEAGLVKARELAPDVILCDIGLPGALDGYAVARALQGDAALAKAYRIALSGYAQPEDQQRARDAGFEAHLAKPPDLDALERLLAELPRRALD